MKIIVLGTPWCKPCQAMNKVVQEIKGEYPSIDIKKIDIEDPKNYDIADKYQVKNIPLTIIEQDDVVLERIVGSISKSKIVDLIQKYSE